MSVCILLRNPRDLHLLPLAISYAAAGKSELILLQLSRRRVDKTEVSEPLLDEPTDDTIENAVRDLFASVADLPNDQEDSAGDNPTEEADAAGEATGELPRLPPKGMQYLRITSPVPAEAIVAETKRLGTKLLIVPQSESPGRKVAESLEWRLLRQVPCETLVLRWKESGPPSLDEVLVTATGDPNTTAALVRAASVAKSVGGHVTALYVEPAVDEVAPLVGERILTKIVSRALGKKPKHVRQRVEVADNFHQGLTQAYDVGPNLVLIGAAERRETRRLMTDPLLEADLPKDHFLAVGIVRAAMPLSSRLGQSVNRILQTYVPQLSREQRVSLVERVQSSSEWNFDFTALMILSTLIASLGLLLNSGAVIIGAMLVAPLMTPIVGSGLAIVQGNSLLFRRAIRSVLQGFALALLMAVLVGLTARLFGDTSAWPNSEMLGRDSPDVLDLLVAFISGLVAAYAMGRPGLTSALPGVAIAAALIPPIATAGMSAAWGDFRLASGALLLFFTNIVAIALATSVSLRSVGIRDTHPHGTKQPWSRVAAGLLSLVALGLVVYESWPEPEIPTKLQQSLVEVVEQDGGRIESVTWQEDESGELTIWILAQHTTSDTGDLVDRLAEVSRKHLRRATQVKLEIRIVQSAFSTAN